MHRPQDSKGPIECEWKQADVVVVAWHQGALQKENSDPQGD